MYLTKQEWERIEQLEGLIEGVKAAMHSLWETGADIKLIHQYEKRYVAWRNELARIKTDVAQPA